MLGIAGTVLLGVALALAPILAFTGSMGFVSGVGIAGIALLILMRVLPRPPAPADESLGNAPALPQDGDRGPPPA